MAKSTHSSERINESTHLLDHSYSEITTSLGSSTTTLDPEQLEGNEINETERLLSPTIAITADYAVKPYSETDPTSHSLPQYGSITEITGKPLTASLEENLEDQIKTKSPFLAGVSVKRFWLIFSVILASFLIACFDSTIMVSSHPVITSYFHSSNSASWLSTSFLLTSTAFLPVFGGLSDTIGRKLPYVFSLAVFLLATIWCALAQSMTSFIIARAVCGLGAGGMITLSSIVTSDLVPIEIRGIYQSYINMVFGVGATSGAALGGWIADTLGWRWEFGIQVPALIICLSLAYITLPNDLGLAEGVEKKSLLEAIKIFDYRGSILLTTSITFLILALNLGGNIYAWSHPMVILSFIIFVIFFPLFLHIESYARNPIMPPKIIMFNPRASLIFVNALAAAVTNGVTFNIPLFFQAVMLESATSSGLRLLVPSIAASLSGTAVGFLITWTKHLKRYMMIGVSFAFLGCFGLSFLQRGWSDLAYLLFIILNSIGQGLLYPTAFMSILTVSPQSEQAVVTSTLILWRSMGTVFGVSISSLILQNALVFFLNRNVIGPDRGYVIDAVRKSVAAIKNLEPLYQDQVRDSYTEALRATFAGVAVLSLISLILTVLLKIPKLGEKYKSLIDHGI